MLEKLSDHPELLTTAILGTLGISEINKGSLAYQKGDFVAGSKHLLAGNGTLTGLAATNELIENGEMGIYTGAQTPFLLAGVAQFLKHHRGLSKSALYQLCVKGADKFTALPALVVNLAIRVWLYKSGLVDPGNALDWLRHLGFTGLSTSFVMSVEGRGKVLRNLTAKQERFLVTFATRAALTLALGIDVINSSIYVINSQDLGQANLLALVWLFLNGMALKQDFRTLDKEAGHTISEKIKQWFIKKPNSLD